MIGNKFTVLMSVYYNEKKENLILAIDSLLNQTLAPNQIVIVEDGKLPDDLYNCLEEYSKKHKIIHLIKLDENQGLGNALNEGLKHCKYDYVARMDADDISVENRFEKQISFLENNPEVDVLGGQIMEFDDKTNKDISTRTVPSKMSDLKKFIKTRNPFNHMTVVFKKKSVDDAGGYKDCKYFEDYYLWARMLAKNNNLQNIDDVVVRARAGTDMTERRGGMQYLKCIKNFEDKLFELKIINRFEYVKNIALRSVVALIPNKLRYYIYQKKLRG